METQNHIDQHDPGRIYRASAFAVESLEGRTFLSTYTVSNTNDTGAGSLRQAITDANNHAGADVVHFAIGSGAKTISPKTQLPGLQDNTTLDATSQPGYAGKPLITLNGSSAGNIDGVRIYGTNCTVKGLNIQHFKGSGMLVTGKGGNHISANYIGTDASGVAAAGNGGTGILLQSPNNVVGGTNLSDRNVISANGSVGVMCYTSVAKGNQILGNYLGTNAAGTGKLGNGTNGVQIDGASGNLVAHNVASGNNRDGILVINAGASLNTIQSNYCGTNAAGTGRLGNGWYGIECSQHDNSIGGRHAGNIASANGYGGIVLYLSSAYGNRVQGNLIGTDKTGTKDLGNIGRGMELTNGAHDNRVGGTRGYEANTISGNDLGGVGIYSGSKNNLIQRNNIGTTANGKSALANTGVGVIVTDNAGMNYIGGKGTLNIIAFNTDYGVVISKGLSATLGSNSIHDNVKGTILK